MNKAAIKSGFLTTGLIAFCVAGIALAALSIRDQMTIGSINAGNSRPASQYADTNASPDVLKAVARHSILTGGEPPDFAIQRLRASVEANPAQPDAFALLAYAEALKAGRANDAANADLARSFDICLVCDEDLTRWRLEFVLTYWADIDESNRIAAFEGADFLRWWHLDYAYVDQLRERSEARGIPFTQYQNRVATPVRPNEVPRPAP